MCILNADQTTDIIFFTGKKKPRQNVSNFGKRFSALNDDFTLVFKNVLTFKNPIIGIGDIGINIGGAWNL